MNRTPVPQRPRGLLAAIAHLAVRRPWRVLLVAGFLAALAAIPAAGVQPTLGTGGFFAPGDDSTKANAQIQQYFPQGPPNLVLLVTVPSTVDDPAVAAAGTRFTGYVSGIDGLGPAVSYWTAGRDPSLRSTDGTRALILARVLGGEDTIKETMRRAYPLMTGAHDGLRVQVGGQPAAEREIQELSSNDLERSELISAPAVFVLLLLVFGTPLAALLPSAVGFLAVLGTLASLRFWTSVTEVSVYSLNLATALSLGLGIDYSLFVLARYREEVAAGRGRREAVRIAVCTAGRTVAFSAVTVAAGLSSMALFPVYYLRSFAYAGIAVVLSAAVASVVVLPAILALLGHRVDSFDVRFWKRGRGRHHRTRWQAIAESVLRRPVSVTVVVVLLLIGLGTPFLRASFQLADDRLLPAGSEAHQVAQSLRQGFSLPPRDAVFVTAQSLPHNPSAADDALSDYALSVSRLPHVKLVLTGTGAYALGLRVGDAPDAPAYSTPDHRYAWVSVLPAVDQYSPDAERLVADIRGVHADFTARVGGNSAHLVDTKRTLGRYLAPVVGVMVGVILVLLFLFTGSVLIPVKAVLCNLLSLTATFGSMVWVFQDGHLSRYLGDFQVAGHLEMFTPILMLCMTFSLSMDYEVFLVSRIHEAHVAGASDARAVTVGLTRTGPLVTSAALLLIVVLLANLASDLTILKMLGLGASLAIAMDATIVRAALVPAVMRLAGPANWWAPPFLRRVYDRFGLREAVEIPEEMPELQEVGRW